MVSRLKLSNPLLVSLTLGLLALGLCGGIAQAESRDLISDLTDARRVFVPADELDVVVERDRRGAVLTKVRFEELLALAKANAEKVPASHIPIVLTSSDYQARVAGDQLLLTVTAELTQFSNDWQTLVFAMQRLAVEKATLDDEPAMLGRNPDGSVSLLSDTKGSHKLKLELSTELNSLGSDQVAAFSLLRAPSGTLSITLPSGKRLLVGALQLERPAPLDQVADYKLAIGGTPGIQLRITDRATDNAADALTFATTGYGLHVTPGEVTWHALTTLQVFGKPVDRLTFSVPNTLEIADVEATGLESWDLTDDAENREQTNITLTFGQAFDGSRKISIKGVMAAETGKPWAVPPLRIANVTSHIGQIIVQHPAGVRLRIEETSGVRRATHEQKPTADMPDEMSKLNATEFLRFDAWQPDFVLRLTTQPKQREVQSAVAAVLDVNATGLDLQAALTVESRFAPLFELDLRLPAEWTVLNASRDDKLLKWQMLPQEAGVNQLRILLDPPIAGDGSGVVKLSLRRDVEGWPVDADPVTVDLPELFLPQSSLSEVAFVVRGDDDLDLTALELKGLDTVPLKADYERLRFQSQDTRYGGQLKVTRKPSRLAAQTILFGRLDPQTTHTFLQAIVELQGGGARTLKVAIPESVGTSILFQSVGARIVEQKPAAPDNGERIWTLQFDQRIRGQILITCDIELPRKDDRTFVVPQPRFLDVERQSGFLAVEAGSEQRLTIDAKGSDATPLSEVDPLDLPPVYYVPKERVVAVYRTVSAGGSLTLSEERFDKLAVPTAVCQMLELASVLGRTGELQHKALFRIMAVGVQGLRVTLPKDTSLWATLVDGQPVEVRRQGDIYLVPLSTTNASAHHALQLFYRSEVVALTQMGTVEQAPPELSVQSGQGTAQPVEILDQRWTVHYPPETRLVSSTGLLEPEQKLDDTSLLGQLNASFKVPTLEELGWQVFILVVTIGVIALFLLVYQRAGALGLGCGTVLTLLLGFIFIASQSIGGCSAPLASHRFDAAKTAAPTAAYSRQMGEISDFGEGVPVSTAPQAPMAAPMMPAPAAAELPTPSEPQLAKEEWKKRDGELRDGTSQENLAEELERARPADKLQRGRGPLAGRKDAIVNGQDDEGAMQQAVDPLVMQNQPNRAPAKQPVEEKADGVVVPTAQGQQGLGLLSLAIDLSPPTGSLQKSFRYAGADPARSSVSLQLGYVDEHSGANLRLFLMALVALLGWFLRKTSCATKVSLAVLGLSIPLALLPLAPQSLQVVLDGVFFGALLACGLWLAESLVRCLESCCVCCSWGTKRTRNPECSTSGTPLPSSRIPPSTSAGLVLFAFILLSDSVFAQKGQPSAADLPQQTDVKAASQPNAEPVAESGTTLIVPFDVGTNPLAADKVLLPYDKFVELYRKAYPEKPLKGAAPQAGGIVGALYAAKAIFNEKQPDESMIEITARFAIRSHVDGQLLVDLPVGKVAARDAKVNGKTAALTAQGDCLKVAIPAAGLHVLDFSFVIPARVSSSTGSFALSMLPVPAGLFSFVLPAKDLAVRINGSSTIFRRVTEGDVQTIELPIDKGGEISVSWRPEQAKGAAAAVVHVDSIQAITLTDAGSSVSSGYQYRVRQGNIADVSFMLPDSLRLQAVNGADVGGWELQGEGANRKLRVIFRRNVADTTRLTIDAFLDAKVGTEATVVDVPAVAPQEITNEIGQVAVFAGDQFSLRAEKVEALSQIDAEKFTTQIPVSRPNVSPQLAYRFSKRPFSLSLRATRQETQANVTAQQAAFVTRRKQLLTARLVYNLTGAARSSLTVALPPDFVVLDVKATSLHDWSTGQRGDEKTLTIDLRSPRLGLTEVVLSGAVARDHDSETAELMFPRPLDATRLDTTAAVWLDEGFTATLDTFDGWRSLDSSLVSPELRSVRPSQPVQFAFQTNVPVPTSISLRLKQATPKLAANGLAMVTVTDVAVIHTLALQWQIDAATTDALVFTTPSFLAGKLEFTGSGIRETTHTDAGEGRTRWTIWLRTPISGKYFATAVGALPPAAQEVEAPSIVFEQGSAGGQPTVTIDGQRQYVLLINSSLSQLTSIHPALVESVQREDVPVVVAQELVDQATELVRIRKLFTAPKWSLQKFAQTQSAPASVNVADLTTIVSRDGTYRGQAVYTIKNRSRQFLAIKLPPQSELLSVFVANRPSRAVTTKRNNADIQLIALPKTSAASLSFPVRVIWRGTFGGALPKSARLLRQEFAFPAPEVISQQTDAEYGIPVARTRWTVYLPDDLDAQPVSSAARHNLSQQQADRSDMLYEKAALQELSDLLGVFEIESSGRTRYEALNNMKQLGIAVHNYSDATDSEFAQQKEQLFKRLSEVEKSLEVDESRKSVRRPQESGKKSGGDVVGITVNPVTDTQGALNQNYFNNAQLFTDNTPQIRQGDGQQPQQEFVFELREKGGEDVTKGEAKPTASVGKGSGKAANLESRQQYRSQNDDNLKALNAAIAESKQSQQVAEQQGQAGIAGQSSSTGFGVRFAQQGFPVSGGGQQSLLGNNGLWMGNGVNPNLTTPGLWNAGGMGGSFLGGEPPLFGGTVLDPSGAPRTNGIMNGLARNNPPQAGVPGGAGSSQPASRDFGSQLPLGHSVDGRALQNPSTSSGNLSDVTTNLHFDAPVNVNDYAIAGDADGLLAIRGVMNFGGGGAGQVLNAGADGTAAWNQAGGLSLGFDLPTTGQKLIFTKVGGDPKLALAIRPQESIRWGLNLVWTVVWLIIGIGTLLAMSNTSARKQFMQRLPVGVAIIAALTFFVVPPPFCLLAFLTFASASIVVAWRNRHAVKSGS